MVRKIYERPERTRAAIDAMKANMDSQNDVMLGPFWYDVKINKLHGIRGTYAEDCRWYNSPQFQQKVETGRHLHDAVWKKEYTRVEDKRFRGDHTKVPRGRVFQFEDGRYKVFTGSWIDDYTQAKELIIDEFQLLKELTDFIYDNHWDIGHGWLQEF